MVLLNISLTDPKLIEELSPGKEVFLCAVCKTKITEKQYIISIKDNTPYHAFTNPYGIAYNVMTVSYSEMVLSVTGPTLEHTWFAGYAWEVIVCAECREHLGWKFSSGTQKPGNFYGLIRDKLIVSI